MNAELLRKVAQKILADPRAFDMHKWIALNGEHEKILGQPCGTVGCIAGHACILGGFSVGTLDSMEEEQGRGRLDGPLAAIAQGLLQVSFIEAQSLFFVSCWPLEFSLDYKAAYKSGLTAKCARITVARINKFLVAKGYAPVTISAPRPESPITTTVPTFATL